MEDIASDDDLLSDMLLDSLEFEPKIATHKMNQIYRSPRYKTQQIIDIVRNKIVIDGDLAGAVDALCEVDVIKKHTQGKSARQRYEFQAHAKRYLETYMAESGVEFALTTRYKRSLGKRPESSRAAQEQAEREQAELEHHREAAAAGASRSSAVSRGKLRSSENGAEVLGTSKADLCVVATKPFKAGDLIILCKGGVKDLTKAEDDALREEAALGRERRKEQQYAGVLGAGRDFSVIRSARKGCSQLLLGPARFVNHDCDPNCEFHRLGQSQMVFRCLRNIGLNEEITTYYGDNYFEMDNAECMCRTCEVRQNGIFSAGAPAAIPAGDDGAPEAVGRARRVSSRKVRSPPPALIMPTTIRIERNGKLIEKTFDHHVSRREFDEDQPCKGPQCVCLTCGTPFWAPEAWWLPDECRRCERHFKIFQGDWPNRVPTEPKWSAIYRNRRAQRDSSAKKLLEVDSAPGGTDAGTPVKLSPLRDVNPPSQKKSSSSAKRKRAIPDDDEEEDDEVEENSDGEVEEAIGYEDMDDDMSDLTSVSLNRSNSRGSADSTEGVAQHSDADKPSGPKMLGKHAKTETLAMYWGAPSTDKRARRQAVNGLESLSNTVNTVKKLHKHRRTASDSVLKNNEAMRSFSVPQHKRSFGSPDTAESPMSDVAKGSFSEAAVTNATSKMSTQSASSATPLNGGTPPTALATHGPQRTSIKNLAMAWGADNGENAGRGARRRTPREVGTPATLTTPTSSVKGEGSVTPPFLKYASSRDSSPARQNLPPSTLSPNGFVKTTSSPQTGPQSPHLPTPVAGTASMPASMSNLPTEKSLRMPPERSLSPVPRPLSESPAAVARNASPLAGHVPPVMLSSRPPGVVPGRKNLRWGKGKVTMSRPAPGLSPLAGPAAAAAASSPSAAGLKQERSADVLMSSSTSPLPTSSMTVTDTAQKSLQPTRSPQHDPLQPMGLENERKVLNAADAHPNGGTDIDKANQADSITTATATAAAPHILTSSISAHEPSSFSASAPSLVVKSEGD